MMNKPTKNCDRTCCAGRSKTSLVRLKRNRCPHTFANVMTAKTNWKHLPANPQRGCELERR